MARTTEPWWVCSTCGKPLARVKKAVDAAIREHRLVCAPTAGVWIRQREQRKATVP